MLPPLASVETLEAWMGASVDPARADAIISAASTLIRSHTGRMWVGADGVEPGVSDLELAQVRDVCITITERVYRNPDGTTQQAAGPYSRTVAAWSALGLWLTDAEKSRLPGAGVSGLASVRVVAPPQARATRAYWWAEEDPEYPV
jgi:hypothetical protein